MTILREQPNQNKEIKIADTVLLSLFNIRLKIMKCATSLMPPSIGLSLGKCLFGIVENYNNHHV